MFVFSEFKNCDYITDSDGLWVLLLVLWNNLGASVWCNKKQYNLSSALKVHSFTQIFGFAGQMFLMDVFLNGVFLTYGIEVISFAGRDQENRIDPMIYIFPTMTKCIFHKFGRSGDIERHDAMCILPLNIVNEKIYIFLWFWMLLLLALTFLVIIFRFFIIFSPRLRAYMLYLRYRHIKKECVNIIIKKTKMGDWFLLYMLGQNIDSVVFKELIHEFAKKLGYHNKEEF